VSLNPLLQEEAADGNEVMGEEHDLFVAR